MAWWKLTEIVVGPAHANELTFPRATRSPEIWGAGLLGVVASLARRIADGFDAHAFHQGSLG